MSFPSNNKSRLGALARSLRSRLHTQSGAGMRVHEGPDGTAIIADRRGPSFGGAFQIRVSLGLSFTCGFGLLDGIVPQINGIGLDGKTKDGATMTVPSVQLEYGPNEMLRSWACVRATVDPVTRLMIEDGDEMPTIVDRNDINVICKNGYCLDNDDHQGFWPLAMFVWKNENTIERVFQIAYFNKRHMYRPPESDAGKGAHYFPCTA